LIAEFAQRKTFDVSLNSLLNGVEKKKKKKEQEPLVKLYTIFTNCITLKVRQGVEAAGKGKKKKRGD